jgi:hypothetical protein
LAEKGEETCRRAEAQHKAEERALEVIVAAVLCMALAPIPPLTSPLPPYTQSLNLNVPETTFPFAILDLQTLQGNGEFGSNNGGFCSDDGNFYNPHFS